MGRAGPGGFRGGGFPAPKQGWGRKVNGSFLPYRLRHGPPTGSPNLQPGRVRTAQFCQFLKPSWLRSKTKQPNPRSNSSPFLQSSGERGGCGFVPAAERSKLSVLQEDTSKPRSTMEAAGKSRLASGTIWSVTLGLFVFFLARGNWI